MMVKKQKRNEVQNTKLNRKSQNTEKLPRRKFIIATEGETTEKAYLRRVEELLEDAGIDDLCFEIIPVGGGPLEVLNEMKGRINRASDEDFEAWIFADRDSWELDHLQKLCAWAKEEPRYHVALSNPNFDYWLRMHFPNPPTPDPRTLQDSLNNALPGYTKNLKGCKNKFGMKEIQQAVNCAEQKDIAGTGWIDRETSRVYRFMQNIGLA